MPYSLIDRAGFYHRAFPKFPPLRADKRWLDGVWVMGNNYKGSGYYGAYPPAYLKRMNALFPECDRVLHLFSGSLPPSPLYLRFDQNSDKADIVGNAETLSEHFTGNQFNLIYADPPYSKEDAVKYGFPMPNRSKVLKECHKVLDKGGFVVWLDTVLPMFSKKQFELVGLIGIVRSTNHRFRVASIFQAV